MQAPETLRPELERLLAQRPAQVADAIRKVVRDVRPCVRLETTRVSKAPLEGSLFREYELGYELDLRRDPPRRLDARRTRERDRDRSERVTG